MGFDIKKFETTNFKDRIEVVPVPRLKMFFDENDAAEWTIRGLTGVESAIAKEAVRQNSNIEAVIKAIGSTAKRDLVDGVKELIGITENVPDEIVQRYSWLVQGSVEPVCTHEMAMKLSANFPEDFYLLTNKIMELTGEGRVGE